MLKLERNKTNTTILVDAPRYRDRNNETFERTTLMVPVEIVERFERCTKGSKSICFEALIEYALDTLEQNGQILIVNKEG
jgi:hypothetical protein